MKTEKCLIVFVFVFIAGCSSEHQLKTLAEEHFKSQGICAPRSKHGISIPVGECQDFKVAEFKDWKISDADRANGITEKMVLDVTYSFRDNSIEEWKSRRVEYLARKKNGVWEVRPNYGDGFMSF